jgi:hypothetical protein
MALFNFKDISFNTIKNEYEDGLKKYKPEVIFKNKGKRESPLAFFNSRIYRIFTASIYKSLKTLEKGKNKEYCQHILQSKGDYAKRKGGDVARQMFDHADYIEQLLKKENNPNLRYSLLGIFTDIRHILDNQKWVSAFKRACAYVDKTGKTNTIVSSFMMIYLALVITFESIGLKLLSFEYDLYTGITAEQSILNIMKTHSSFMKSVVMPMIRVICICLNSTDPLKMVNDLIRDEETVKTARKKAQEGGYPYKSEENGLTAIESFQVEQTDNTVTKSKEGFFAALAGGLVTLTGGSATAGGVVAAGFTLPVWGALVLFAVVVILLLCAVPVARMIIYWASVRKVDLQKELEMQAELLNNNIMLLQEKLEKTHDKAERARLQNIINKQIALLVDLQGKIKKYLDEEYEASVAAEKEANDDEAAATEGDEDGSDNGDGGFEVDI